MTDILLRPWKKEDAMPLAQLANNKKIWDNLRDNIPFPYTISDAEKWIGHCLTQKPVINFAIIYKSVLAGSIGCFLKPDVYRKSMEVGYFIGENFWNQGIATKALHILMDYIEKHFDVVRIYAEVFENNKASMAVLRKNGFYLESIHRKAAIKNDLILDDYVWVKLLNR